MSQDFLDRRYNIDGRRLMKTQLIILTIIFQYDYVRFFLNLFNIITHSTLCPISPIYSKLLYEMGQDFLDIQYPSYAVKSVRKKNIYLFVRASNENIFWTYKIHPRLMPSVRIVYFRAKKVCSQNTFST